MHVASNSDRPGVLIERGASKLESNVRPRFALKAERAILILGIIQKGEAMFRKLLTGAIVALLFAVAPASAQTLAMHMSGPAVSAIDNALDPPPKHMRHNKATKKHKAAASRKKNGGTPAQTSPLSRLDSRYDLSGGHCQGKQV